MRILLKGHYGFGNLGDDILMISTFNLLNAIYPSAEYSIFSNNTPNNRNFNNIPDYNNYIHLLLNKNIEIIDWTSQQEYDLIFNGGGGIYNDVDGRGQLILNLLCTRIPVSTLANLDGALRWLIGKPKNLKSLKKIGAGIGIGKYSLRSKKLYHDLVDIGTYDHLAVRDNHSYDFLAKHGAKKNRYSLNTDLAFLNSWNPNARKEERPLQSIGIIIKGNLQDQLVEALIELYHYLDLKNLKVTFYSFDENYDACSNGIFDKYSFKQYRPRDFDEFIKGLYQEDIFITSRAHGAIIGACLGIPSIILNLETKLFEVSKMLDSSCIRLDSWALEDLKNAIDHFDTNFSSVVSKLHHDFLRNQRLINRLPDLFLS